MADDTNFCDGRLRLTAFLRVAEHDLPQRPSRFKRRMPLTGEEHSGTAALERAESESEPETPSNPDEHPSLAVGAEIAPPHSPAPPDVTPNESIAISDRTVVEPQKPTIGKDRIRNKGPIARRQRADEPLSAGRLKTSRTPKRRLPLNTLPLLRTTTSDGLPDPVVRSVQIVPSPCIPELMR